MIYVSSLERAEVAAEWKKRSAQQTAHRNCGNATTVHSHAGQNFTAIVITCRATKTVLAG